MNYKAGTYVEWSSDVEHMAANIGVDCRYTLQINIRVDIKKKTLLRRIKFCG